MIRICFLVIGLLLLSSTGAVADNVEGIAEPWQLNFQEPATPVMEELVSLHDDLVILITAISVFVLLLMLYICVRFNHKSNPTPSKTTHNTAIEVIWTVAPIIILVFIAIPSVRLHYFMDQAVDPDMTLKVTGYQWYWGYQYPDNGDIEFLSYLKKDDELGPNDVRLLSVDNPVVVPVNKTVRVLTTGADVIHAWAVPAFGVKQDTVPGRQNETWFRATKTGIYYGQCSELCGKDHGFMPIEIRVVEQDVFDAWVERAKNGDLALDGLQLPKNTVVATDINQ